MAKYTRQHWVPQSYLRRFSPDGDHVWMLDRPTGRIAFPNVADVARSKFFNDSFLRDESGQVIPDVPESYVEELFGKWETALAEITQVAQRVADGGGAGLEERQTMAICVALQLTRTQAFRKRFTEGVIKSIEEDANNYLAENCPDLADKYRATFSFPENWHAAMHHHYIWESGDIPAIANDLFFYIWRIGVNTSRMSICTSDTPVISFIHDVVAPPTPSQRTSSGDDIVRHIITGGRPLYGIEIIFPLTPKVLLLMYHPGYFAPMQQLQGKRTGLDRSKVLHYNSLQLLNCDRQIYSYDDDFDELRTHAATYAEIEVE